MTLDGVLKFFGGFFLLWVGVVILWLIYEAIKTWVQKNGAVGFHREAQALKMCVDSAIKIERKRQRLRMRRYTDSIRKALNP